MARSSAQAAGPQQMRCAVGSGGSGRHSRGRSSTHDEQRSRGRSSTYDEQRSRGRSSTHAVLNYSNPGKELWSGHGAFRRARRRRRGSRLRRPLTPHTPGTGAGGCLQILANAGAAKGGRRETEGRRGQNSEKGRGEGRSGEPPHFSNLLISLPFPSLFPIDSNIESNMESISGIRGGCCWEGGRHISCYLSSAQR
jgi:hypothetical protein